MDDLTQQTRAAAFRLLLESGRPVAAEQIAPELNASPSTVERGLPQWSRLLSANRGIESREDHGNKG